MYDCSWSMCCLLLRQNLAEHVSMGIVAAELSNSRCLRVTQCAGTNLSALGGDGASGPQRGHLARLAAGTRHQDPERGLQNAASVRKSNID